MAEDAPAPNPSQPEVAPSQAPHPEAADPKFVDELVGDPELRRAIELYVQQNIQQTLHLREGDLLPDPEELARFDQVVPGLAATIANEWQTESAHRRRRDESVTRAQLAGYRRYQWFAFILILVLIAASAYLFSIGKDAIGFLLALVTAASVVTRALLAFVGARASEEERRDTNAEPDGKELAKAD